jgi:predicted RNA binding protein YcfA (HicA-like mRNA interferase family)
VTRIEKLYAATLANPAASLPFRDFERLVRAFGFTFERQRGSHRSYSHPRCPRLLVIQPRGASAKPYQVREFLGMIEEFELTLDD